MLKAFTREVLLGSNVITDGGRMRAAPYTIDRKLSCDRGPTQVSAPSLTFNRWDNPDDEVFRAMKAMSRGDIRGLSLAIATLFVEIPSKLVYLNIKLLKLL